MKTILYVDDDPDDREIFGKAFENFESCLHLRTAEDGFDALRKLASGDIPCCMYIDINMPKMNGMELLKIIKSNPQYSSIPAFIFSTSLDPAHTKEAKRLGAAGVFTKPTSFQGLLDQLHSSFSKHFCAEVTCLAG